jgi:hypothetical protein
MLISLLSGRSWARLLVVALFGVFIFEAAGCQSSESATFSDDPTTRALADPMAYSPDMDQPNISGGGLTNFDSKAFKKDVDDVFSP